jgi:S1-C subfamily serine protease
VLRSAVSTLAACLVMASASAAYRLDAWQLSDKELSVWHQVQPSILALSRSGVPCGAAACIDPSGLFIAHQNSFVSGSVVAMTMDGRQVQFRLVYTDRATGLTLMTALAPEGVSFAPVHVTSDEHPERGILLAVLASGPVRADITRSNIVATSALAHNQSVLVDEVQFDAPVQLMSGALIFDGAGSLVGILGANLPHVGGSGVPRYAPVGSVQSVPTQGRGNGGGQGQGQGGAGAAKAFGLIGPSGLTVAYSIAPVVLNRVVTGFISPTHEVEHPALGAVCVDAIALDGRPLGVRIVSISTGSGAAKAGLKVGDYIQNIDGMDVPNVVEYARAMLSKEVGHRITIAILRDMESMPVDAVVGRVDFGP